MRIYGDIYWQGKIVKGTIEIVDGIINDFEEGKKEYDMKGNVISSFINAHTHIGDYFIKRVPKGTIPEIVGPGGFKHQKLKEASENQIKEGMKQAIEIMKKEGISHFADFREGGINGLKMLSEINPQINSIKLGRPKGYEYDAEEIRTILDNGDGIGLSSISDYSLDVIEKIAKDVKRKNKIFGLHASENIREDFDFILDLKPTFLVHMLTATDSDLEKMAEEKIPLVITPRSNAFFSRTPNIPKLLKIGIKISLGTDNGMLVKPSISEEMIYAYKISNMKEKVHPQEILKMSIENPRKIFKIEDNKIGEKASLIVLKEGVDIASLTVKFIYDDIVRVC